MKCRIQPDRPGYFKCARRGCNNKPIGPTPDQIDRVHPGQCAAWPTWDELGEWAALLLAALGINPRRWSWLRRKLGFIEPRCQCDARKFWLNTLGGQLATSTHWLCRLLTRCLITRATPPASPGKAD